MTGMEILGLALIQKIPTPITPVRIDKEHRHITLAYFDKISTVDYIGAVQGSRYVSMPRSAVQIRFLSRMYMRIRWILWRSSRSREESLFC